MSEEPDMDVEERSWNHADWNGLSEEWPVKLRNQGRQRKMMRQSSGNRDRSMSRGMRRSRSMSMSRSMSWGMSMSMSRSMSMSWSRLDSFSPLQKRLTSSPSGRQKLGESLKKNPTLPVTCGNKEGILHKDKFNKSEPCILSNGQWFTPTKFEKYGGKEKNKKWKISIQHNQIQLQYLIQDGILSSPSFKGKHSQDQEPKCRKKLRTSRRSTRPSKNSNTSESASFSDLSSESDHSDDDDDDDDDDDVRVTQRLFRLEKESDHSDDDNHDDDDDDLVTERMFSADSFNVTCSTGKGVLHVNRFAAETCGKCIRTQDAWLTPKDFLNQNKTNGNWRRDITSQGVPLGMLIMRRVLKPHTVNCKCPICKAEPLYLLDQNNDDTCFKCKRDGDLVCCDKCPRAFHHQCHKPALMDDTIGENWTCSFCKKSVPAARKSS